jgi:uncharacterized protein YdaU (DUF1376 family)
MKEVSKPYFPHDFGARSDPKLLALRLKLGMEGVGIYWCLVEFLHEQNGKIKPDMLPLIAEDVHCSLEKLKEVVTICFKTSKGAILSSRCKKNLEKRRQQIDKNRKAAEARWH